ncbi:integrase arm-type DNA-binding domain-containing protein [Sphingosinicella sp.]|uniref:tyrosine-type recombinase/integrase n=1 Tax=Sphingosinicella sp. TaxID=1917971 RepID=UPI00184403B7|nr:integrase arm-type DNA-binding domain-containing protein [Sphingosinicella sp.]MBA4757750.1 tyrosine-type recombinase/integrase [Sphingosinicella sp.]
MPTTPKRRSRPATVKEIDALRTSGKHSVGDSLLLVVGTNGTRSWIARVRSPDGRRRDIGLGPLADVSLAEAREKARELRGQTRAGLDPLAEKRKAARVVPTFEAAARKVYAEREDGWKSQKHREQWLNSMEHHVFPKIGRLPINAVTGPLIVEALKPIWTTKPETASRALQRIASVVAWGAAHGYRDSEAPVRAIRMGLPPQPRRSGHFAAMPYTDVPSFMQRVRAETVTVGRLALQFVILTAARSGEARGARWDEFDTDKALWTIPKERMKAGDEHVVPLSPAALALLKQIPRLEKCPLVFPGVKRQPLCDATLGKILRDAGETCTVHGFRSSFRDWISEETNFPGEVAEKALAHKISNAVEAAYRRGTLLEKRRAMMNAWAAFLEGGQGADVIDFTNIAATSRNGSA